MLESKQNKIKKILIIIVRDFRLDGVTEYLYNVFCNYNSKNISVDIFIPGKIISNYNANRFKKIGIDLIENHINNSIFRLFNIAIRLNRLLKCSHYDIVHINSGSLPLQAVSSFIAKKNGIMKIISHSHSEMKDVKFPKSLIYTICRIVIMYSSNVYVACSKNAAYSMFGKKQINRVIIARNGIDINKFRYSFNIRNKVKYEYNLEDKIIIGCVANFVKEKNHEYLLKIFNKYACSNNKVILLLVGDGELQDKVQKLAVSLGIQNKVLFLGSRNNVYELLQIMDVFVLTSFHEGLPMSLIEAQASGLPCVISDTITQEVKINNNVYFASINDEIDNWIKLINKALKSKIDRNDQQKLIDSVYDIKQTVKIFSYIYNLT